MQKQSCGHTNVAAFQKATHAPWQSSRQTWVDHSLQFFNGACRDLGSSDWDLGKRASLPSHINEQRFYQRKEALAEIPAKRRSPPLPRLCIYLLITCLWEQTQCLSCIKTKWNVNLCWYNCNFLLFFPLGKKRTLSLSWKSKWRRWKCNMRTA